MVLKACQQKENSINGSEMENGTRSETAHVNGEIPSTSNAGNTLQNTGNHWEYDAEEYLKNKKVSVL